MPTPNTPHRQPTKQEINEAVEALMFGRDWDAVAANLGLGPTQARAWLRAHTSPIIAQKLNAVDPGPPRHGTVERYGQSRKHNRRVYRQCIAGVGACDACKHANSRYEQMLRRHEYRSPAMDADTLEWVAQMRATGLRWDQIADRYGCPTNEARTAWREQVWPRVCELVEESLPTGPGDKPHGTVERWAKSGCRCAACGDYSRMLSVERARRAAMGRCAPTDRVDAQKAVDHLRYLLKHAESSRAVGDAVGLHASYVRALATGSRQRVWLQTEQRILAATVDDVMRHVEFLPSQITVARVRRMLGDGWARDEIADATGVAATTVKALSEGQNRRVRRWVADAVQAVAGRPAPDPERRRRALERQEAERRRSEAATRARYTVLRRERARQREDSR